MNLRNSLSVRLFVCILIVYMLYFSIITSRGEAGGLESGSNTSTEPMDQGIHELIASDIT